MSYLKLRTIEKLSYIIGLPILFSCAAYKIYHTSISQEQERQKLIKDIETQYLTHYPNLVKLENFKKKIFVIGVTDKLSSDSLKEDHFKFEQADNMLLIRDLIKDIQPEVVLLEMCQDRYDQWFYDLVSHPNYDRTISSIHKVLDTKKQEAIAALTDIDIDRGNLEYLIGLDTCSYRMTCTTVFGDRAIGITKKRYNQKLSMIQQYKDSIALVGEGALVQNSKSTSSNIFSLSASKIPGESLQVKDEKTDESILKLKSALKEVSEIKPQQVSSQLDKNEERKQSLMNERAIFESKRTPEEVYDEVVIDEVNAELLKSAQKCDGSIVVMLIRKERLKSFETLWRQANLDYYQTQTNRIPLQSGVEKPLTV